MPRKQENLNYKFKRKPTIYHVIFKFQALIKLDHISFKAHGKLIRYYYCILA